MLYDALRLFQEGMPVFGVSKTLLTSHLPFIDPEPRACWGGALIGEHCMEGLKATNNTQTPPKWENGNRKKVLGRLFQMLGKGLSTSNGRTKRKLRLC